MRGVSTREYQEVLPQMAATVGVSRSAISRKVVEASIEQLKQLQERRWENVEILVIYIDGQRFAEHHILSAVGVDGEGKKHILGIESGATENAASVKRLLTHLRDHGLPADRQYLFIIDGAKALRAGTRRYSERTSRCNGAAITRCATSSMSCPKNNTARP
jgi:transposase-like protein